MVFAKEDLHGLDVISLLQGQTPFWIGDESDGFRHDTDQYLRLRKRLGPEHSRFILCTADLSDGQAAGLAAMQSLAFVHLPPLRTHLQTLAEYALGPKRHQF